MDLESVVVSRINRLKLVQSQLDEPSVQMWGIIEDQIELLEGLLEEGKTPAMEQEVEVKLTLSVDAKDAALDISSRILASLSQLDGMTVMAIEMREEAEIYGNE